MSKINVFLSENFSDEIKHLRRKYPSVIQEAKALVRRLEGGELPGDKLQGTGHDAYKVRLANPSANRGKSGGFRAIYFVQIANRVILISIYSKSEQTDISTELIQRLIQEAIDEHSSE